MGAGALRFPRDVLEPGKSSSEPSSSSSSSTSSDSSPES